MENKILQGKTSKTLVSMSVPISLGMLSTFLFQVVDTYFVGQLGADALAALSFASTIYFLVVGVFIGLSVGVSIIIGKAAGGAEQSKILKTNIVSLLICFLLTSTVSAIGYIAIEPIFSGLGAEESIIPLIVKYMQPMFLGMPLLTTGIMAGGILRATGTIVPPELLMAIAGIINVVLDYALIFGKLGFPEMGITGAAIATVSSWVFIIIGMFILLLNKKLVQPIFPTFRELKTITKEIFQFGAPTIVTQMITPLTLMYLTYLLAKQSTMAVAAFGIAGRVETLLMIGILGVSTAITPFIAQNLGAKKTDRIEQAIVFGGKASMYLGLLVTVLLFLFIKPIAELFSKDENVLAYTADYFYIVSISYVLYGLYVITTSIFNGLQLPKKSLKISLVRSMFFTVPFTIVGSFWGIEGIFIGLALSNAIGGIYAAIEMRKELKRAKSSLSNVNVFNAYINEFKRVLKLK